MPSEQLVSQSGNKEMYSALLKPASDEKSEENPLAKDLNNLHSQFQDIVTSIEIGKPPAPVEQERPPNNSVDYQIYSLNVDNKRLREENHE